MKRRIQITITVVVVFLICTFNVPSLYAEIDWYYDSPLAVYETITDIGGGDYSYEYFFENTDSSTIWKFGIYTTFSTTNEETFAGYPVWERGWNYAVSDISPEYDARNLDPEIAYLASTAYEYWFHGEDDGILINDIASGFTFISSIYDSSPKYYMYETIESGQANTNGTGKVAAVGTTVPEPATLIFFALSGLMLRRRR